MYNTKVSMVVALQELARDISSYKKRHPVQDYMLPQIYEAYTKYLAKNKV